MRILAVDDDPLILEMLQSPMWLGADHTLVCVYSAAAAMTAIAEATVPFDAFLLDVAMPGRNGIELCADIRSLPAYAVTPIIMITASRGNEVMQRAYGAGATDFVTKPLDGLELGSRINMAALLNDSIRRERSTRIAMDKLHRRAALGFDDKVDQTQQQGGPVRYLALENSLLALPKGCHAMTLFAIQITPFELAIHDTDDSDLLLKLDMIGQTISHALTERPGQIAYIGRGTFVGVTSGRRREPLKTLATVSNAALIRRWRGAGLKSGVPQLTCQSLSSLGVWAGRAAADRLREFIASQAHTDVMSGEPVAPLKVEINA